MRWTTTSLLALLAPHERKQLGGLLALALVLTAFELIGAGSFFWYTAIVMDPARAGMDPVVRVLATLLPIGAGRTLLLALGIGVFLVMVARGIVSATNLYAQARFSLGTRNRLSRLVLARYLTMPYEDALAVNSAVLTKHLLVEVGNVVTCIQQSLLLVTEGCIALALIALMAVIDPLLVLVVVCILGGLTGVIIVAARRRIATYGRALELCNAALYQSSSQALQGAKEIRVFGAETAFLNAFQQPLERSAALGVRFELWSGVPGMLMNLVAFGTILIVFLMIIARGGAIIGALPAMVALAFVLQRLLPSANRIYNGFALIRKYEPGIAIIRDAVGRLTAPRTASVTISEPPLPFVRELRLTDVHFTYRGTSSAVLDGATLVLPYRSATGIVGASGAGKSTLVDLLLGLLDPTDGTITCDGVLVTRTHRAALRQLVGYVPQHTFLLDDTIRANVAFGIAPAAIDDGRVQRVLRIAQLDGVVAGLPDGIASVIGERGVRLSGGQRQRLGIARALYRDPAILVLDEATSALDPETEDAFLRALEALTGAVTLVVIAHRLSSLRACNRIAFLNRGRIAAAGTIAELTATCQEFRERYVIPASELPIR